jgi:hypothetical protein
MQNAGLTHERVRNLMDARDDRQFLIEHTGEGEKIVALILERDTHGTDALPVRRLTACQLLDDEIKQHLTRGQNRSGKCQNVMVQPLGEHSDIAGQPTRLGFVPPRESQFSDKVAIPTTASAIDPGLQLLAPRRRAFGETHERVGKARALAQNVKHIAVARRIAPGRPLSGAQALPGIGDRVVGFSPRALASSKCTPQVSASRCCSATRR